MGSPAAQAVRGQRKENDTRTFNPLFGLLAAIPWLSAAAPPEPPYSRRGIEGAGVFPAEDLVTEFWDLAPDMVTSDREVLTPGHSRVKP